MGDDGAKAMANLRTCGGRTIAQDEATSVVFGMPGELVRLRGASAVLPAHSIADQLVSWLTPPALASARAVRTSVEARHGSR
jgi:two-component system chemotaxis response regulator CheB